jgi:TRAP-type transport system periplasmic protein
MSAMSRRKEMRMSTIWHRTVLAFSVLGLLLPVAAFAGEISIKLAHTNNPAPFENPASAMAAVFKGVLEEQTRGQIKVNLFPSAQLGKEREIMEALKMGSIQAVIISEGTTVNFFPPMEVMGIPFLFPSKDVAWRVMDGPFGTEMKEAMRKDTGIRIVAASAPGGFRNFAANKPLRKVEDLKGLRIRTMEHPAHQAMVKALGASPTPVPFAEMYSALKSGIVDGVELPYQAFLNMKMDEVIKYMIADGHLFNQEILFVNEKWLQSLSTEQQRAVLKAGSDAEAAGRGVVRISDAVGADQLREKGVTVYFPTEKERQVFKDLGQAPVVAMVRQRVDKKWVDGVLRAVEEAAKER